MKRSSVQTKTKGGGGNNLKRRWKKTKQIHGARLTQRYDVAQYHHQPFPSSRSPSVLDFFVLFCSCFFLFISRSPVAPQPRYLPPIKRLAYRLRWKLGGGQQHRPSSLFSLSAREKFQNVLIFRLKEFERSCLGEQNKWIKEGREEVNRCGKMFCPSCCPISFKWGKWLECRDEDRQWKERERERQKKNNNNKKKKAVEWSESVSRACVRSTKYSKVVGALSRYGADPLEKDSRRPKSFRRKGDSAVTIFLILLYFFILCFLLWKRREKEREKR